MTHCNTTGDITQFSTTGDMILFLLYEPYETVNTCLVKCTVY